MIKHKELILFYFKQNELNFFKYYYTYIKYFIIYSLNNNNLTDTEINNNIYKTIEKNGHKKN